MSPSAGSSSLEQRAQERHARLMRDGRGPLSVLAELARVATDSSVSPPQALCTALRLLEEHPGVARASTDLLAHDAPPAVAMAPSAPASRPCVRVPIVHRDELVGALIAEVTDDTAEAARATEHVLSLAAAVIAGLARECRESRGADAELPSKSPAPLVGRSAAVLDVWRCVEQVAATEVTVLVRGECGTGKDSVAQAIHALSARAGGAFVVLSSAGACSASEHRSRHSPAALAEQAATLFVDDVGELAPEMQAELLDLLRSAEDEAAPRAHPPRVIAATRIDLQAAVRAGRFRKDLYYRLAAFPIDLPPLRARRSDLPQLAAYFMSKHAAQYRKAVTRISEPALGLIAAHDWPGNLRELDSCMLRAVLLAHFGVVRQHHLPSALQPKNDEDRPASGSLREQTDRFERAMLADALERTGGNRTAAAQLLGTTLRVLSYRIKRLGV